MMRCDSNGGLADLGWMQPGGIRPQGLVWREDVHSQEGSGPQVGLCGHDRGYDLNGPDRSRVQLDKILPWRSGREISDLRQGPGLVVVVVAGGRVQA